MVRTFTSFNFIFQLELTHSVTHYLQVYTMETGHAGLAAAPPASVPWRSWLRHHEAK